MTSYADAGVDIEAGERAVELMKGSVRRTARPEVIGGLGGFAGLFELDTSRYRRPVLASSTDGVGTKIAVARAADRHDTIGIDLVAMVVDDLVVVGAEPLFLTDYIATGRVVPEKIAAIVAGIAEGCVRAGCALVGGETAEHPGRHGSRRLRRERRRRRRGRTRRDARCRLGSRPATSCWACAPRACIPTATRWPGRCCSSGPGSASTRTPGELAGRTLADELLEPTRIYALDCLALARAGAVHAFAHVTGGGLAGNLARVLPAAPRRRHRPGRLDTAGGVRAHPPGWRRGPGSARARRSTWASAWSRSCRRATSSRRRTLLGKRGVDVVRLGHDPVRIRAGS